MGRTNYALMSLVAAIPGFVLAGALTLAFLKYAGDMPRLLPAVAGLAWLVAVLMAVTPVGILLFGGSKSARAAKPKKAVAVAAKSAKQTDDAVDTDESFVSEDEFSEEVAEAAGDDWNEGDSAVDFAESDADEFEFEEDSSSEIDADFDFDDDTKR